MALQRCAGRLHAHTGKLYLFAAGAKLSEGVSLARTDAITRQMIDIAHSVEGIDSVPAYVGLNALQVVNTPNITNSYVILKPFGERHRNAAQINAELNRRFGAIKDGFAYALMPPPIQGLGNGSGYSLYLEDRAGLGYGGAPKRARRIPGCSCENARHGLSG
ncbi:RND efflux system, inner membrane transporter CmeB [Candidatus Burkholderia brachyanthoides]|nr:RND efflux system, inner membrane transporter CmeB [Candidatus Burkholderia brachyanthoides]